MERKTQILGWLKDVLDKNLSGNAYNAFIFGSQANKTELIKADIDVGIITADKITDQQLSKIHAEIENLPMLYNVDLVNFNEVDARFKTVALSNVERI